MNEYILALLGVIILGVIVDVLMPSGQLSSFIKTIYSVFVIFIIISPISNIISTGFDISSFFNNSAVEVDGDLLYIIYDDAADELESYITTQCEDIGFYNIIADISVSTTLLNFSVESVIIDISNLVIITDENHINKYDEIIEIVTGVINIEEEDIVFV